MAGKIGLFAATFFLLYGGTSASEITGGLSNQGVVPIAPSVTATSSGAQQITVSWFPVASVEGYRVYRIKDGAPAAVVATTTTVTYADAGLANGTYAYQVRSFLGSLESPFSLPTAPIVINVSTGGASSGGGGGGGGSGGSFTTATTTPVLSAEAKKVDVNGDNKIDVIDFNSLMVNWGGTSASADFNSDGAVNIFDFNLLMVNWTG